MVVRQLGCVVYRQGGCGFVRFPVMGATFTFGCPVKGCGYSTQFRLEMGEEDDPDAHNYRSDILRGEHPDHSIHQPVDPEKEAVELRELMRPTDEQGP
jgi:hypothetical protein